MYNLPFAVVDFETGGLDPDLHDSVQIAVQVLDPRTLDVVGTFVSYIKPDPNRVSLEALNINNLSLEELENAPSPEQVVQDLVEFLKPHGRCVFVAHNAKFDFDFLSDLIKRHGKGVTTVSKLFDHRLICTVQMAFQRFILDEQTLKSVKLVEVSKHLQLPHEDAHDALGDVRVTAELFRYCLRKSTWFKAVRGFKIAIRERSLRALVSSLQLAY